MGAGPTQGFDHQHLRTLRYHSNAILLHLAAILSGHYRVYVGVLWLALVCTADLWCRNWSSAMFGGVLIIAIIYYVLKGRHDYVGPVMLIKRA